MGHFPHLYALKNLSQKVIEISIYEIASAFVAETIYVQKACGGDCDILGKYKNQVNSLSKLDRESLYKYIRLNSSEEWLRCVWDKTKKAWWYELVNESTISLMPFINKLKKFELENNRPYPIGDEILCGKEVWPKIVESEPKYTHNNYAITQNVEKNSHNLKNEICTLYDNLVKKRGGEDVVKEFEYIWQWLISQSEYNNIYNTLTHCRSLNGKEQQVLLESRKCIWVIVAYIAEQYKREWNGQDGEDNAILQIGLDVAAKDIAEQYFKNNSNKVFRPKNEDNRITNRWLDSLRMEGGLPVKYIVDKNKLDFTKDIYENPQKAIEALEENTQNRTRVYSYNQKYSIYEYVLALIEKKEVYSNEDASLKLFKEFQKRLDDGRANAEPNRKFGVDYSIWRWHYPEEFVVHRGLCMKAASGVQEEQDIISVDRIQTVWKIAEPTYVFWLRIGNKDYEFYLGNGGYRSTTGRVDFPLPDIDLSNPELPRVQITYIPQGTNGQKETDEAKWKDISNDIVKEQKKYILFSSKDGNRWFDGQNSSSIVKGAVLILNKFVKVEPIGFVDEIQLDGGMRWIEFDSLIKIDGKLVSIGYTDIQPKIEVLHPIHSLKYVHNIRLFCNEKPESIWLLKQSGIKKENFKKMTIGGKSSAIEKIEYYDNTTRPRKYRVLENEDNLPLGLTWLRFDDYKKVFKFFVLSDNANIQREIAKDRGKIIISNIDNIEGFDKKTNTYQREFIYENIDNKVNTTHEITIKIDDSQKIVMDVVYPWKRQVRVFRENITNEKAIPRKFASKYKLVIFDENGVNEIDNRESLSKYNRKISKDRGRYRVGSEEGLEFVFMATDGTEYPLNIKSVEERTGVCYYLTGIPTGQKGVIFQSLKNKSPELAYYEHLPIDCNDRVVFHRNMGSKIDPFLKCEEHNLYYDVLLYKEMLTPKWFFDYCKDCMKQNRVINYKHLWLAAKDCEMDWILDFPRTEWLKAMSTKECEDKKKWVKQLFGCHPQYYTKDLTEFVEKYWELKWNCRAPQDRSDDYKKFLFFAIKCELDHNNIIYTDNNGNTKEVKWEAPKKIPTFTDIDIECEISR